MFTSMQHWIKLTTEHKPPARDYHSTCFMAGPPTGQQSPLLMVVGGLDDTLKALSDVWLLDVEEGVWSEVRMLHLIV